jgi:uncharacterized protein (TIGR01777 family)
MKVFITGGTGFLGSALTAKLLAKGHTVAILTRSAKGRVLQPGATFIEGNPLLNGTWQDEAAQHDVLINLAGASIFCRWSEKNKKSIRDSRILTTRNLVEAISLQTEKEITLLNGSAVGYYGFRNGEEQDEAGLPGHDFLAQLVQDWEAEATRAEQFGARVVLCRIGVILGKDGGALSRMLAIFKWGLGSRLGSGAQWFSWVALHDLVNIFLFLMENKTISGPVNCSAPHPVTNREMTMSLGKALHRPVFLPAIPSFILQAVMGEFSDVFLKGQKVIPQKLLESGFVYKYPLIDKAFADLVQ